jgi:hypothetical protein
MTTGKVDDLHGAQSQGAKDIKSIILAIAVLVILGVATAILFYNARKVENPNYMGFISAIDIAVALVLVWIIPGHKQAYFWGAVAMGVIGFVIAGIALAMHGFAAYAYQPLSRVGIGLFLCSLGAGAAAYLLKKD